MIRIAIVDDDPHDRQVLREQLITYETNSKEKFEISEFDDGEKLVKDYQPAFDIILLDIEMEKMDGMTAAEHVREIDNSVVIIFLTNMPQYAIRGYAVEALDYVLKPVSYYAFEQCLSRALKRRQKRGDAFLRISAGKGHRRRIRLSSVYSVVIHGHTLVY